MNIESLALDKLTRQTNGRTKICNPRAPYGAKKTTQIESRQKALEFNFCNVEFIKILFVFSPLFCLEEMQCYFFGILSLSSKFPDTNTNVLAPKIFEVMSHLDD